MLTDMRHSVRLDWLRHKHLKLKFKNKPQKPIVTGHSNERDLIDSESEKSRNRIEHGVTLLLTHLKMAH